MDLSFTQAAFMAKLGYVRIPHSEGNDDNTIFDKYENVGGTVGTFYGPMFKGKRIVWFNRSWAKEKYTKDHVFVQIDEDGGTRKVFHGGVQNGDQLKLILALVA